MSGTVGPARPLPATLPATLRALTAASVLLSAVVHLELWADGMRDVSVVGPSFLLQFAAGIVIAVAVLARRGWLPLAAAAAFGAGSLAAFTLSTTSVGFFGVHETWDGVPQILSAVSEAGAVLFAVGAWVAERRRDG